MKEQHGESFIRWQGRRIEQLGFINNIVLGFGTALIAVQMQIVFGTQLLLTSWQIWGAFFSTLFIFASVVSGCYLAWNRLESFRLNAQVARKREKNQRDDIEDLRNKVRQKDERTWNLIKGQIIFFVIGILFMLIAICARLWGF